ncbi:hypothetical protein BG07_440 [Bacillus pseudomycoides]|nr:hypothetical protein DJ92_4505 [Bacillus pseudomycoides]AJI19073.1 hypothetical protein BG07_440 [Bacillus pseudomycoides]EEM17369.1 hypothetical protein bpmyx0001_17490 [Bacillus pseudomycoides DSM 12442]
MKEDGLFKTRIEWKISCFFILREYKRYQKQKLKSMSAIV